MNRVRLLVIGGGPAGYVAAIRAAQLGAEPVLVEGAELGGTCLNRGCVPTKSLIESTGLLKSMGSAGKHGIKVKGVSVDLPAMVGRKDEVARFLRESLGVLLAERGVDVRPGWARFAGPREAIIAADGTEDRVAFEQAIICTGSVPWVPPLPGFDLPGVIGSDEALNPDAVPATLAVIGGGAVGCEFATIYNALGAKVTLIELLPSLIPTEDAELGDALRFYLEAQGVQVMTGAKVEGIAQAGGSLEVKVASEASERAVRADRVLAAIGRRPRTQGLQLEQAGVSVGRRGEISVDASMRTNVQGIYAAGDVTGGILLAHVGFEQGVVAAENAMGRSARYDGGGVPRCIYTEPEVAGVGLTEAAAREEGYEVAVGRFPFQNSGRALAMAKPEGFVKVVAEAGSGQLLGMHIIGPHATELIAEAALALHHGSTVDDIVKVIHAHPTLAEAVKEACLDTRGEAIHK